MGTSGSMRPFVALTFVLGCAYSAPAELGVAGVHALGYAAAPAAVGVAAAPIAYGAEHYSAGPVVAHAPVAYAAPAAPAPYTTAHQASAPWTDQLYFWICHQDPQASNPSSSHRCPNCPQGNPHCQRPHCKDPNRNPQCPGPRLC